MSVYLGAEKVGITYGGSSGVETCTLTVQSGLTVYYVGADSTQKTCNALATTTITVLKNSILLVYPGVSLGGDLGVTAGGNIARISTQTLNTYLYFITGNSTVGKSGDDTGSIV